MDTAVALVQAYLRVNGYFTVAEYPVLEAQGNGPARTVTDLDILALRLHRAPGYDGIVPSGPDPALGADPDTADMIVGEVKEGSPHLNPAMRDPAVLEAAFARFGCCPPEAAEDLARDLLRHGRVVAPAGHVIRLVVFGNPYAAVSGEQQWHTVSFEQVFAYVQRHLSQHWSAVGHTQIKDDALGLLALLEKSRRARRRGAQGGL